MSKLHPKRRVYAKLDEWLAGGGTIPAQYESVNWLLDMLMWEDDLYDILEENQRSYIGSWLRVNVVPATPPVDTIEPVLTMGPNNWKF